MSETQQLSVGLTVRITAVQLIAWQAQALLVALRARIDALADASRISSDSSADPESAMDDAFSLTLTVQVIEALVQKIPEQCFEMFDLSRQVRVPAAQEGGAE